MASVETRSKLNDLTNTDDYSDETAALAEGLIEVSLQALRLSKHLSPTVQGIAKDLDDAVDEAVKGITT